MKIVVGFVTLALTGCATYTYNSDPFVVANQTSQITSGLFGPNNVTGNINTGMNYYRNSLDVINNPWNGVFILRNLWIR